MNTRLIKKIVGTVWLASMGLAPVQATPQGGYQEAYLKAVNPDAIDHFGFATAISDDTVVVGAYREASNATGVGSDSLDNSAPKSGAAYVFVRSPTDWSQQAYLKASNAEQDDCFGHSVAVDGNIVVVGAFNEASSSPGVNGNESDNGAFGSGAAYVFARNRTSWVQQAYLKGFNPLSSERFGFSVSVSGDLVVVGAPRDVGLGQRTGAAYVFERVGTAWHQQAILTASNAEPADEFGFHVAVDGETIVVGAPNEDSQLTGVNPTQDNNTAVDAGAAYVFVRDGTTWIQQAYLKASNTDPGDFFGTSVDITQDMIVVGATHEASASTGVGGNQNSDSATQSGAAYVFVRDGTNWSQQAYLKASNAEEGDRFGTSVGVSGNKVIVGAIWEDSSASGVNADQGNSGSGCGAAYVFSRTMTTWRQESYIKALHPGTYDFFGGSVGISGTKAVVGAYNEDSAATGVNGDQSDDSLPGSGAAYAFTLAPVSTRFCDNSDDSLVSCPCHASGAQDTGCEVAQGTGGVLLAAADQETVPQNRATWVGTGFPAQSTPAAIIIRSSTLDPNSPVVFGDGLRCVGIPVVRLSAALASGGAVTLVHGHGSMAGTGVAYYQLWFRNTPISFCDPVSGYNLSNGRTLSW